MSTLGSARNGSTSPPSTFGQLHEGRESISPEGYVLHGHPRTYDETSEQERNKICNALTRACTRLALTLEETKQVQNKLRGLTSTFEAVHAFFASTYPRLCEAFTQDDTEAMLGVVNQLVAVVNK